MTKADLILLEARELVVHFNSFFHIQRPIIVRGVKGSTKDSKGFITYAYTWLVGTEEPTYIDVSVQYFTRKKPRFTLEEIIFHEMVHIALWPLTRDNRTNSALGKYEEEVVWALQGMYKQLITKG